MLLVATLICLVIGAVCQVRLLGLRGVDALLGAFVHVVAQIVLLSLLLATMSAYTAWTVAISVAAVATASLVGYRITRRDPILRTWPTWRVRAPCTSMEWVAALLVALVALHVTIRTIIAVRLVPYGYDALSYHLAAVGWLVQDGRLPGPETGVLVSGYPLGGELLAAWPAVLLHDDALSRVPQILTALLGGASTTLLARAVGAARAPSITAGCLFVLTPALLAQTSTAYVDVTAAALSVTSVCFLLRWAASGSDSPGQLVVAGLSAGLAVGTKHTAVLIAVCCLAGAVAFARTRRGALRVIAIFGGTALLAGGGWYLENLLVHGNPVYPFAIAGLSGPERVTELLTPPPGPPLPDPLVVLWSWAHDLIPRSSFSYEERVGGLGAVFVLVALPCLLVIVVRTIRRKDRLWALLLFVIVVPFALQPYQWWARFTFTLAALGAVAVAAVLSTDGTGTRLSKRAWQPRLVLLGVTATVLVVQPALLVRTVVPPDGGGAPIAAWQALTVASGDRLASEAGGRPVLAPVAGAATVAVAVDEVGRVGSLFGAHFERHVHPVAATDARAFAASLSASDVLVACRSSRIGRWAALDPEHLRLMSDPASELAIWEVLGPPSAAALAKLPVRGSDAYCT